MQTRLFLKTYNNASPWIVFDVKNAVVEFGKKDEVVMVSEKS
jgi:hypothetical protein